MLRRNWMNSSNPWDSIELPSRDVSARRVDHTHPLGFFWAIDNQGRYLFLCEFPEGTLLPTKFPDLAGVEIYPPGKGQRLILALKAKSEWKIFHSLCNDIVIATRDLQHLTSSASVIVKRLNRWQDFLKNSRPSLLPEERIKGLLGELLLINKYLVPVFGIQQSLLFWRGPEGYSQDFEVNDSAIEVKCQSGVSTPHVKISSEDQLCCQLSHLYLHVFTMGRAAIEETMSINLPKLIADIRKMIRTNAPDSMENFNDKLFQTGYIDQDEYSNFNYIVSRSMTYKVTEGFPRICRNQLHDGVQRVRYTIALSHCEPFRKMPEWMEGI
jgi:hypothetical protein